MDLTVYPGYAVVEVFVDQQKGRTRSLYYDGEFSESGLGTTTAPFFDVSTIDADAVSGLSRKARRLVEDANQWYLIVRAPDPEGAVVWAYASNAYGEGGYVSAGPGGKVIRRVTW